MVNEFFLSASDTHIESYVTFDILVGLSGGCESIESRVRSFLFRFGVQKQTIRRWSKLGPCYMVRALDLRHWFSYITERLQLLPMFLLNHFSWTIEEGNGGETNMVSVP